MKKTIKKTKKAKKKLVTDLDRAIAKLKYLQNPEDAYKAIAINHELDKMIPKKQLVKESINIDLDDKKLLKIWKHIMHDARVLKIAPDAIVNLAIRDSLKSEGY